MKRIDNKKKNNINGGFGPMMVWVVATSILMAVDTIVSSVSQFTSKPAKAQYDDNGNRTGTTSTSQVSSKNNGYMRISPFPMRSAYIKPL